MKKVQTSSERKPELPDLEKEILEAPYQDNVNPKMGIVPNIKHWNLADSSLSRPAALPMPGTHGTDTIPKAMDEDTWSDQSV